MQITTRQPYETLKKIGEAVSMRLAAIYVQARGGKLPHWDPTLVAIEQQTQARGGEIEAILAKHGITGAAGGVTSSATRRGEVVHFIALQQGFEMVSPELLSVANQIARQFTISVAERGDNSAVLKVVCNTLHELFAPTFGSAAHLLVPDQVAAIDRMTGDVFVLPGTQYGGAWQMEDGLWGISHNVQSSVDLSRIIHEVVHARWPEGLRQQDAVVDDLVAEIQRQSLGMVGADTRAVELERLRALERFRVANSQIRDLLS